MFNLAHIAISVSDIERSEKFYKNFGFTVTKNYEDEKVKIKHLTLNGVVLEVFCNKVFDKLPDHAKSHSDDLKVLGTKHFGIGCEDILKAKAFVEENKLYDGEIKIINGRLGKPYFWITDPDGIWVEIIEV